MSIEELRARAVAAFQAGVDAADPARATTRALAETPLRPMGDGTVFVIAMGKAACAMAEAALDAIPDPVAVQALAVTNYENARDLPGCRVMAAGHPVPDENGLAGARAVADLLDRAGRDDLVLALISGGSSALVPLPIDGVTLDEKAAVNKALLAGGLDIVAMNLVRQALSQLKGGGFLRRAAPASVRSLILSDVVGDDLRVVGSGPTVAPIGPVSDARALLDKAGLLADMPASVRAALNRPDDTRPLPATQADLIGGNAQSLTAMADAAHARQMDPPLVGDVQAAAARVVAAAKTGNALAFGGETTVTLTGDGKGGRNQELALRFAVEAEKQDLAGPWVFLSGGTDGRDGPTDAAGGLVDHTTLPRLRAKDINVNAALARNDSYAVLQAAGDLLMTGATGTNVADLQLFLRG